MDYFELLKAKHGLPVSDAYTALLGKKLQSGDYPVTEIFGQLPFSFLSRGESISEWAIYGKTLQNGTPTPTAPIEVHGVGKLVSTDWTIPISSAGQTATVNLGQTHTVRRIKKFVLTGDETFVAVTASTHYRCRMTLAPKGVEQSTASALSTHYFSSAGARDGAITLTTDGGSIYFTDDTNAATTESFKAYLTTQYAAGTPVTVWYVLAEPATGIVNEPLMKIGDYADELRSTDAGAAIQTVAGVNTLTTDTTVHGDARIKGRIQEI